MQFEYRRMLRGNEKLTNRELIALLTEHLMIKKYY